MTAPKFEKRNHHYVPQFWQRGFRDNANQLHGRIGGNVGIVSPRTIMQDVWLYTLFDDQWRPSDTLEDTLSVIERQDAELLKRLNAPHYVPTQEDETQLCALLGLQASRHPDVLKRCHSLSRKFGEVLASVHDYSLKGFQKLLYQYGMSSADAKKIHTLLKTRKKEQLVKELGDLLQLSPQSPALPAQDAIRAAPEIEEVISGMQLCLLDAVPSSAFILGDTPIPQSDLGSGFSVPLSKSLAVISTPANFKKAAMTRRPATQQEVDQINRIQFDNALNTVVGPSAELLNKL